MEWPALVAHAAGEIDTGQRIIHDPRCDATYDERMAFLAIQQEAEAAKQARDAELLQAKIDELDRLGRLILHRQSWWWFGRSSTSRGEKAA